MASEALGDAVGVVEIRRQLRILSFCLCRHGSTCIGLSDAHPGRGAGRAARGSRRGRHRGSEGLRKDGDRVATHATMAADAAGPDGALKDHTAQAYPMALERLMVVEDQPAWTPHLRSRARLRSMAKRHFSASPCGGPSVRACGRDARVPRFAPAPGPGSAGSGVATGADAFRLPRAGDSIPAPSGASPERWTGVPLSAHRRAPGGRTPSHPTSRFTW